MIPMAQIFFPISVLCLVVCMRPSVIYLAYVCGICLFNINRWLFSSCSHHIWMRSNVG
ncbi:hypothetical protein BJX64DRAFT_269945, partial [Aspergillus heterothallicus]